MKKSQTSKFSAQQLFAHQQETGFRAADCATSAYQLDHDRERWAAKKRLIDQLYAIMSDGEAQITLESTTGKASMVLTAEDKAETLVHVLEPILAKLRKEMTALEGWILKSAVHVEKGINECGFDLTDGQWAIVKTLMPDKPKATPTERCPLLPELTATARA